MSCRVLVEVPHKHHHQGKQYNVRIDIGVAGGEIAGHRDHAQDVYVAFRDAFDVAKRHMWRHRPASCGAMERSTSRNAPAQAKRGQPANSRLMTVSMSTVRIPVD